MRLLTRYLLKAFLGPLMLCLICFNAIFIVFDLFGHLSRFIDSGLSVWDILRYYGGVVSMYSHWFLPASCMLATLYTMWQLSHHSELTAMRASGISFRSLTYPFLGVAIAMSLLTLVNSEFIAPEASTWSERLKESSFTSVNSDEKKNFQYVDPSTRRSWIFSAADPSTEQTMSHPSASVEVKQDKDGVNVWGVRTTKAEFLDGVWWFQYPQKITFDIDGQELHAGGASGHETPPTFVPMYELTETPRAMMLEQRDWDFFSLADMYHYLKAKRVHDHGKWYEFYYRIAAPWACVVITLFAIPAGISTGRQSVIKGVILALTAFFSFYAVTLVLKFLGHHGVCPPVIAALLPHLIFLLLGFMMYKKLT